MGSSAFKGLEVWLWEYRTNVAQSQTSEVWGDKRHTATTLSSV